MQWPMPTSDRSGNSIRLIYTIINKVVVLAQGAVVAAEPALCGPNAAHWGCVAADTNGIVHSRLPCRPNALHDPVVTDAPRSRDSRQCQTWRGSWTWT